jgi:hypothetical protein
MHVSPIQTKCVLCPNNQVEEDEMGGSCSTNGGEREKLIDYWWESQRERDYYEDQDAGGWILGWILERWDGVMWTGLVWLRIGTGGELL